MARNPNIWPLLEIGVLLSLTTINSQPLLAQTLRWDGQLWMTVVHDCGGWNRRKSPPPVGPTSQDPCQHSFHTHPLQKCSLPADGLRNFDLTSLFKTSEPPWQLFLPSWTRTHWKCFMQQARYQLQNPTSWHQVNGSRLQLTCIGLWWSTPPAEVRVSSSHSAVTADWLKPLSAKSPKAWTRPTHSSCFIPTSYQVTWKY